VRLPSARNVRGFAREFRDGYRVLSGARSRIRWMSDLVLIRLPPRLRGPARHRIRTVRLLAGVSIRYRLNRGDLQGFREVWIDETYRLPETLADVRFVVDLGANIGLTSVFWSLHHAAEHLVAVEPVPENAEMVRQNLAINRIHGTVIEAVVGPNDGIAYFADAVDSNLGHRAASGREVKAISMRSLIGSAPHPAIDLLKIDIEGAEEDLLLEDASWLDHVRALMIEFHPEVVDQARLERELQTRGFRNIPAGSVLPRSTSTFVRSS
jgi:FkbM family methyltransferase